MVSIVFLLIKFWRSSFYYVAKQHEPIVIILSAVYQGHEVRFDLIKMRQPRYTTATPK